MCPTNRNWKGTNIQNAVVCILIASFLTLYHDDVVAKGRLGLTNLGLSGSARLQSKRDPFELGVQSTLLLPTQTSAYKDLCK